MEITNSKNQNIHLIAFYLPQFHPIPLNDIWWGKGFTEWSNVIKAKPLFHGHYQPIIPSDLGYYDLRSPAIRIAQAQMARFYGIEGFCYWHYWMGDGKQLLEAPFQEVLNSGQPDFPFCLGWANHSWYKYNQQGKKGALIIEQKYGGKDDYKQHFEKILPAFLDQRYIKVDGKPFFLIFSPQGLPDPSDFMDYWRKLALTNGLPGIHFVAQTNDSKDINILLKSGYDAVNVIRLFDYQRKMALYKKVITKIRREVFKHGFWCDYKKAMVYFSGPEDKEENIYPTIIPNWDHTIRRGKLGTMLKNSTPELFQQHIKNVFNSVKLKSADHAIVLIKSWNEWGEGNYLEPDTKYGRAYLEILKKEIIS